MSARKQRLAREYAALPAEEQAKWDQRQERFSAEMAMLEQVFEPITRREQGPTRAAGMAGHDVVKDRTDLQGYRWTCSCGRQGVTATGRARQDDIQWHYRMSY